ncbi:lipid IV(A) 4-amino-4-deoxy-L-arabinosyltransferase [Pantoea sp. App145]|uniref:lipid IV(A) 4-amino-4-deoxy-L-arabinosyltransferase n=1 Tax=Pantoea sp. App145 TaxID=3071567 RepID=UPI003A80A5B2
MTATTKTLLLLALLILYYLVPLEFRHLWQPDETRYAEISREMLQNGNWITPHFFDLRYFEKPIAGYWFNNIGQWLFGHNNFAVRIGAVFSTLVSAVLVFWLARRLYADRAIALTASVIFLTSLLVYGVGTYAVLDPILSLWLVAAMCSYWYAVGADTLRQRLVGYILFGLACGMGFMTKGFLALAVPVLVIVPWAICNQRFRELLTFGPLTVLCAALLSAPWALAINQQQPDFWHYFFWIEHIQRFADSDAQHKAPFWYYIPILIAGSLPWLALLPGALRQGWTERKIAPGGFYLLCWILIPLVFFSIAKGKLLTYILPCFAPLAILMACYGHRLAGKASRILRVNAWINILFGTLSLFALLVVFAPWGISHRPLYQQHEVGALIMAAVTFAGWGLAGFVSLRAKGQGWQLAALCPLALALCVGNAIPESVQNTKQPQVFVASVADKLAESRFILSDDPGIASTIAWTLQRSDMYFYDKQGEVRYGLSYPDSQSRFVSKADFPQWLATHRKQGTVSVVLMLGRGETTPTDIPPPDLVYRHDRMLLLQYGPEP